MTLKVLRENKSTHADKVEQRLPKCNITKDLFGIFDVVSLQYRAKLIGDGDTVDGWEIVGIQITSRKNGASRRTKIAEAPQAEAWILAGGSIELWLWDQPGGPRTKWRYIVETIALSDLGL